MLLLISSIIITILISNSPLTLGFYLLLVTIIIALSINSFTISWFRFLILLIYVGGMLVIFAYFRALQPNQPLTFIPLIYNNFLLFRIIFLSSKLVPSNLPLFNKQIEYPIITNLINPPQFFMYISLVIILLFTLIAVVKIATKNVGPLRPYK